MVISGFKQYYYTDQNSGWKYALTVGNFQIFKFSKDLLERQSLKKLWFEDPVAINCD